MDIWEETISEGSWTAHPAGIEDSIYSQAMSRLYAWICLGAVTTAAAAWLSYEAGLLQGIYSNYGWHGSVGLIVVWFAALLLLGLAARVLPSTITIILYLGFTALSGLVFSGILSAYAGNSIATALAATAAVFGTASFIGLRTKRDLSGLGSMCLMGIAGLVIASVANWFIGSGIIGWLVTLAGLPLFIGLTVWETKEIKQMAQEAASRQDEEAAKRIAVVGAVGLYVNLLNLFVIILDIVGWLGDD